MGLDPVTYHYNAHAPGRRSAACLGRGFAIVHRARVRGCTCSPRVDCFFNNKTDIRPVSCFPFGTTCVSSAQSCKRLITEGNISTAEGPLGSQPSTSGQYHLKKETIARALARMKAFSLQSLSFFSTPSWSPRGSSTILSFDPTERRSRI